MVMARSHDGGLAEAREFLALLLRCAGTSLAPVPQERSVQTCGGGRVKTEAEKENGMGEGQNGAGK